MKNKIQISLLILLSAFFFNSCARIDAGHVGIVVKQYAQNKGVQDLTECTGTVWYNPLTADIIEWPTYVQHVEYTKENAFVVNSKDGSEFHASPILNYNTKAENVVEIYRNFRRELSEVEAGFIKTAVYEAFRLSANSFTADSLISNREKFESEVRHHLDKSLDSAGFTVSQFTSGLAYPESYRTAIDAKNAAVQTALMVENQVKTAEANSKIKMAKAEGDANSMLTIAKAEAEANKLKQQTLSQMLIQQQFIEKWNGVLPVYGTMPQIFKQIE